MTTDPRTPPVDPEDLAALHTRLARAADANGLLEIAYREIDSPVGPLLLAATPRGVVRVAFAIEGFDAVLTDLATRLSPRVLRAPNRLEATAYELDGYFSGRRTAFDLPLDHALSSGFRARVQAHLTAIPYGETATYAQVAAALDNPKAIRAVGSACATNPLPILQPCHRVLRSDRSLGGYLGGLPAKEILLALEGR